MRSRSAEGSEMTDETNGSSPKPDLMSTPPPEDNPSNRNGASTSASSFKLFLLVMMVLQNSSTVLVGRYTRSGVDEKDLYEVSHLILITEAGKFILSCMLEFYTTRGKLLQSLQLHIFDKPLDALKILVPALLYLVQNTLLYVALSNLTAPIFQVTYQGKLVTTALVSVVMLQRRYSFQQWVCLVGISLGVATVVLGESTKKTNNAGGNLFVGLVSVTIACMSSALAGVYFEKVLKKPVKSDSTEQQQPASLWMRNMQLAFFSVCIAMVQYMGKPVKPEDAGKSFLHGFSAWVWILVGLQAGGGLLVAAVIKYADNVLKGLATGVSVVVSTLLSCVFFGTSLTGQFSVGAVVILSSVYFFSNPIPACKKEAAMKNLLPK